MNRKFYNFLKKRKVKICLVSPELVKIKNKQKIRAIFKKLINKKIMPDAVCTKYPFVWENLKKKYEIKSKKNI